MVRPRMLISLTVHKKLCPARATRERPARAAVANAGRHKLILVAGARPGPGLRFDSGSVRRFVREIVTR